MQFRGKVQRRTIAARCCFSFFFFVLLPFVLAFNQIKTSRWTASERNFFDLRARQIKLNLTSLVCYDYLTVNGQPRRSFCIYALSIRWTRFDASWNWNWRVCATICVFSCLPPMRLHAVLQSIMEVSHWISDKWVSAASRQKISGGGWLEEIFGR